MQSTIPLPDFRSSARLPEACRYAEQSTCNATRALAARRPLNLMEETRFHRLGFDSSAIRSFSCSALCRSKQYISRPSDRLVILRFCRRLDGALLICRHWNQHRGGAPVLRVFRRPASHEIKCTYEKSARQGPFSIGGGRLLYL
jgi:hypothetical protein